MPPTASMTCAAEATSVAPASSSRSSSWQPTDIADVTGPGTTMTCLPSAVRPVGRRLRARPRRRLDDDRAAGQRGDQPVAHQEPVLVRRGTRAATR